MDIECLPKGICSWDYLLRGPQISGTAEFDWSEGGALELNGSFHRIEKMGPFKGHWMLLRQGRQVCEARKPSIFSSLIELDDAAGRSTLQSAFMSGTSRTLSGPGGYCDISRAHPFTRRTKISGNWTGELETLVFAFWLSELLWRRNRR
jgi:hypothetical protein